MDQDVASPTAVVVEQVPPQDSTGTLPKRRKNRIREVDNDNEDSNNILRNELSAAQARIVQLDVDKEDKENALQS